MSLTELLPFIKREYNFHIYHTVPVEKGYRIETNVGPKFVSIWEQWHILQWSFLWREEAARAGFRQIDRFIRSRDGSPYVQYHNRFIVVQDLYMGKPVPLDKEENIRLLGQKLGLLFQAFKKSTALIDNNHTHQLSFNPTSIRMINQEELQSISKELVKHPKNMFIHMVQSQWKAIEKRLKQSITLYNVAVDKQKDFISPAIISMKNWLLLHDKFISFSSREQVVATNLIPLGHLLQDLYDHHGFSIDMVDCLLSEFEKIYQPSTHELYLLLSVLLYPEPFIVMLRSYLGSQNVGNHLLEEEYTERWINHCERQEKLDSLHRWLAERIDRLREDRMSL